ncbi:MAG TPA: hypothetical protein VE954_31890 [Oligoflexus sp.]|uniref:hypothetical protein n=1 Tax=Oligoflexus sp. TaxID=1971216 RepID=UPI002D6A0796|nr:hypothetical protein [Oligoflexus sp.]HYX37727.1 hypothetical protein [Oligoflexus sp.]
MKLFSSLMASAVIATVCLSGCGKVSETTSSTKDVADCHSIFSNRVRLSVGPYLGSLTVYPQGTGLGVASIEVDDGLEASCGRSDVTGSVSYSYVPFTPDYTLTLDLTSASCGNRRVVVTGDCTSNGVATAEWDGYQGTLIRNP